MRYLARLLADPDREYHVLDLVAAETGSDAQGASSHAAGLPRSALGDAGESLDAQAKDAYRRRLAEIDDDRHLLRLRSRPSRPRPLEVLTSTPAPAGRRRQPTSPRSSTFACLPAEASLAGGLAASAVGTTARPRAFTVCTALRLAT
jgi:hypothetical protein